MVTIITGVGSGVCGPLVDKSVTTYPVRSCNRGDETLMDLNPQHLKKLATMKMPFGKYQGRVLMDLPEPYLLWFAKRGFPNGELGLLLALMLEIQINGLESLLDPLR